jgi:GT2 family glycosyltransferase
MPLILVTGMHRSGTSLVAGLLGQLGADLGPAEGLMPATEDNPKGYFESTALSHLDERALARLGGTWSSTPARPEGWAESPLLDDLRQELREHLQMTFPSAGTAAIVKDPRASLLLPFWRTAVEVDRTLLVLREPGEVAGSLAKRNGFSAEHSAGLWLDYVLAAWEDDPGRATVTYAELLEDPRDVAVRLAGALGLDPPSAATLDVVAAFAEPALQRNAGHVPLDGGEQLELACQVYEALSTGVPVPEGMLAGLAMSRRAGAAWRKEIVDASTRTRQVEASLADALAGTRQVEASLAAAQESRRREVAVLREQSQRQQTQIRELQTSAAATQKALADAQQLVAKRTAERDGARRQVARAEREFARLRNRRSVRLALAAAEPLRPLFRRVRASKATPSASPSSTSSPPHVPHVPHVPATVAAAAEMAERLRASVPPADAPRAGLVSVLVLNRDGEHHLRRLLPGLAATTHPELEVVLVDNASTDGSVTYAQSQAWPFTLRILQNAENTSFSAGNNQALAEATGEYVLLLNNDIEPVDPSWLSHMVDTLEREGAGAVGARLVYPRRPGLVDNAGDLVFPDLTLQHRGIHFATGGDGVPTPRNLGSGEDPVDARATAVAPVPAVTAACLLTRREHLLAVGGLSEDYVYGTEDVDLCLRLREEAGPSWYDGRAVLWHHEYGTQNAEGRERKRLNRIANRQQFVDQWGPALFRELLEDKLLGTAALSEHPLRVGITLTKDDVSAGWGDYYTAHELGDALVGLGWDVVYLERYADRWYQPEDTLDVVVVLLDSFDLSRYPHPVVSIAWIRNWTHRWVGHDWFDDYDLVLVSSRPSQEVVETNSSQVARLFPLATNPERFRPQTPDPGLASNALFVGNYWHQPRGIIPALQTAAADDIRLYGANWQDVPGLAAATHGPLDYALLPLAYSSTHLVIDDTAGPTKPYGAVNSRVFDALATGTLVATDNVVGAEELFQGRLPVWRDSDELLALVAQVKQDPAAFNSLAEELRAHVLEHHTYQRRAEQLRDLLLEWVRSERIGIAVGVPSREVAPTWGDHHYGRALQRQLRRAGHPTTLHLLPEWPEPVTARSRCVVHLLGLSRWARRPGQLTVLWNISHPELVDEDLLSGYDLAMVASAHLAGRLAGLTTTPVHVLNQATDLERFRPSETGPHHELLFVGNSRGVRRRIIDDLTARPLPYELAVYGGGWNADLVDLGLVRGEHVPNDELAAYYAAADVVLNDHWDGMREAGFISNRVYDALAAGACVVSDHVEGIEEEFDGAVTTYSDAEDLHEKLHALMEDPGRRRELAERGRRAVVGRHGFEHRTRELLAAVRPLLAEKPSWARHGPLTTGRPLR